MFSSDCFVQRLKLIAMLICFDFLLDLLLCCRETPLALFQSLPRLFRFHQKTEKLNTVSLQTASCRRLIPLGALIIIIADFSRKINVSTVA